MAPHDIPKEEEIHECAISWQNHGYNHLEWEKYYSCELLVWPNGSDLWLLQSNTKKFECSTLLSL
jgi:hypothetical protein